MINTKAIERAYDKAFRKANLIGEDCDLWKVIYSYKIFREMPEEEVEKIYDQLSEQLGFNW